MVKIKNSLFSFVTGFLLGVVFSFVFLDHSTDVLILFGIAGGLVMVILFTIFRWVIQMAVKNTSNHLNIDKSFFWSLFSLFFFCIIYFVMYFLFDQNEDVVLLFLVSLSIGAILFFYFLFNENVLSLKSKGSVVFIFILFILILIAIPMFLYIGIWKFYS